MGGIASRVAFYVFIVAFLLLLAFMLAAMIISGERYLAATVAGVLGICAGGVPRLFGYGSVYRIPIPVPRSMRGGALAFYVTGLYLLCCALMAASFYLLLRFVDSLGTPTSWAWTPALLLFGLLAGSFLQALDMVGAIERAAGREDNERNGS